MYKFRGRCGDMAPFALAAEQWPIVWNPPGWGSTTDLKLKGVFGPLVEGDWYSAMLIGMKPLSVIPNHVDAPFRVPTTRVHVVLASNSGCWNWHDGQWHQLEVGGCYEMDQTLEHGSVNMGASTRFHLIVDLL